MGIKNLRVILNQKCKLAINNRKLDSYSGMIMGIDISIFLYKYLYNNDDHIEGLTRLSLRLLKNHIMPIYVFDGKPPKEKDGTLQERRDKRELLNIKKNIIEKCMNFKGELEDLKNLISSDTSIKKDLYLMDDEELKELLATSQDGLKDEYEKVVKKIIYVRSEHIESAKKLFDLMGVGYIHAPCEAESLLAVLCQQNLIDGCISEDSDILANGGQLFLRNLSADKNNIEEYCLEGILQSLELNQDEFIDMCILCGCDYLPKIIGLGPITAHKIILKYKNIEAFMETNNKYIIPPDFDYKKARYLFKNPVDLSLIGPMNDSIKLNKPNILELKNFLKETKLKEKFMNEIDKSLMNYFLNIDGMHKIESNSKITDYFTKKN